MADAKATTGGIDDHPLVKALCRVDPLLIFLTRATGQLSVPLPTLRQTLPSGLDSRQLLQDMRELIDAGVLRVHTSHQDVDAAMHWDNVECRLGFPPPPTEASPSGPSRTASLHGSTKTAAKRRLAALKRLLKQRAKTVPSSAMATKPEQAETTGTLAAPECDAPACSKDWETPVEGNDAVENPTAVSASDEVVPVEQSHALDALAQLLGFPSGPTDTETAQGDSNDVFSIPSKFLPRQVSYAGSTPAQESAYGELPDHVLRLIPVALRKAFGLGDGGSIRQKRLYRHQATAIAKALEGTHCSVCTGTGSGKSLCFLLPVLTAAYNWNRVSLVLFPTKALAQDQLSKLHALLSHDPDLQSRIRPAALDGDVPHSNRLAVAEHSNVIFTNPDTLHAAILPAWKTLYKDLLSRLEYVVIDEGHIYEGVFGAHVAMILSRLVRVGAAATFNAIGANDDSAERRGLSRPIFLGASATLPWPEQHFRLLCPIASSTPMVILSPEDDGSPRSAKHFFVWNPPILHSEGSSTGSVTIRVKRNSSCLKSSASVTDSPNSRGTKRSYATACISPEENELQAKRMNREQNQLPRHHREPVLHRRHAADETALLLARAVMSGVRCIAFCKTRNLVEWVFERAHAALSHSEKPHLATKIESYRGGYSMEERRKIEQRLFQDELLGVVGTNALELGVDIGGIDLTLHCGYPSSYASLLQQAGRAGRGKVRLDRASCAVVVCFNSPSEQHMWRNPTAILGKGATTKHTIPVTSGLVQGHLLCAGEEFPLTGGLPVTAILSGTGNSLLSDQELFGGIDVYNSAMKELCSNTLSVSEEQVSVADSSGTRITVYRAHASLRKPWSRVSIRSIEPVNYALIDLSHPGQGGRQDGIHDAKAILDTIPYSRIFYHAHPGAVITHRGRKMKVVSMTRPPPFGGENFTCRRGLHLASYAQPTNVKYATRPLSNLQITVVKQFERIELPLESSSDAEVTEHSLGTPAVHLFTFAGCGAVSVKRTVHGYKKLSLITRTEIERSELTLPPMEYDTFGVWLDMDADSLAPQLGDTYGPGVHALSHALLAVAPVYAPGLVRSDLDCDHAFYAPTRLMLFDERAGGSGASERLWSLFFQPNNIMDAAIDLLEDCSSCGVESGYDAGCPACLHASNCIKFNMHLSRSAGAVIGRRLLSRLQSTALYQQNLKSSQTNSQNLLTPRRQARRQAVRNAKEMHSARDRQFVVGRVSWPLDES